ncbi:(2Fe-2S)-binding protein [Haloferax sp. DFSO52]|uniref:(2Fe-2S)-binding protein n=1 Tax=Haloferax sp. DFSO52 TaxID=3388505 RepID=UPI003A866779
MSTDNQSKFSSQVEISFELNGEERTNTVRPNQTLVEFLRQDLEMTGTTEGCGVGVCGCCTVLVDERPVSSCQELAVNIDQLSVTTVEGLGSDDQLSPVQDAFQCEEGFQCGYCTPGMMVMTESMINESAEIDDEVIQEYMAENLCRCTGYESILSAVNRAVDSTEELED